MCTLLSWMYLETLNSLPQWWGPLKSFFYIDKTLFPSRLNRSWVHSSHSSWQDSQEHVLDTKELEGWDRFVEPRCMGILCAKAGCRFEVDLITTEGIFSLALFDKCVGEVAIKRIVAIWLSDREELKYPKSETTFEKLVQTSCNKLFKKLVETQII